MDVLLILKKISTSCSCINEIINTLVDYHLHYSIVISNTGLDLKKHIRNTKVVITDDEEILPFLYKLKECSIHIVFLNKDTGRYSDDIKLKNTSGNNTTFETIDCMCEEDEIEFVYSISRIIRRSQVKINYQVGYLNDKSTETSVESEHIKSHIWDLDSLSRQEIDYVVIAHSEIEKELFIKNKFDKLKIKLEFAFRKKYSNFCVNAAVYLAEHDVISDNEIEYIGIFIERVLRNEATKNLYFGYEGEVYVEVYL